MEKGYLSHKVWAVCAKPRKYISRPHYVLEQENKYDQAFFSVFSLSKLGGFIKASVTETHDLQTLQADLDSIDLPGAIIVYSIDQNKNILSWMSENRFISEGIAQIICYRF